MNELATLEFFDWQPVAVTLMVILAFSYLASQSWSKKKGSCGGTCSCAKKIRGGSEVERNRLK